MTRTVELHIDKVKANKTLTNLLILVASEADLIVQPGIDEKEAAIRYGTLKPIWEVAKGLVGEYGVQSFNLESPDGKDSYRRAEHWMKILERLYGPQDFAAEA